MSQLKVTAKEAVPLIEDCLAVGDVPFLHGWPGIGKSAICKSIAKHMNLKVIDYRLATVDPTELNGFAVPDIAARKGRYIPMETFPLEGEEIPDGYEGWLLFLDEMNMAALMTQGAAFKLVLDKEVGLYKLHDKVYIVCAGNLVTDSAMAQRLSPPMKSRLAHLELMSDRESWNLWATEAKLNWKIIAMVNWKKEIFNNYKDHGKEEYTYACERTWDRLGKHVDRWGDDIPISKLPLIQGIVGCSAAREFYAFAQVCDNIQSIDSIIANPDTEEVSTDPGTQYAITGMIGSKMNSKNADKLMIYVRRMKLEFQIVALQIAIGQNQAIMDIPAVEHWVEDNAEKLAA